ncbi:MAG: thioredoxin domain-containing protein, partial [Candidatus Zixiibacteriota bacterium]
DWYPWGEEALNKARELDRPIFLSIGYAACHWCHVMERESFENEAVAVILNEHFVSIKVDREQRPDLDNIYMAFTVAMNGNGGWPMTVFLTPDLKPFFTGTYFPPEDGYGRPGFGRLLSEIVRVYRDNRNQLVNSSEEIFRHVVSNIKPVSDSGSLAPALIPAAARELMQGFDRQYGGFGQQPKFPHPVELSFFLRHFYRTGDRDFLEAAEKALKGMARGGIYDQLGGGFARYATDRNWLVPHFEKMLYDNALLVETYAEAYQLTGEAFYLEIVTGTLDFMLREMRDETGGFYAALDADSEGEEGKFYVWSKEAIERVLGEKATPFMAYYGITASGNFEGHNILHVSGQASRMRKETAVADFDGYLKDCRDRLFAARSQRIRPLTDDKILTSWNGLALSALCRGYQVSGDERYLKAAFENAVFVLGELGRDGKLTHAYRKGVHSSGEFLEDYAFFVRGLLDLYESDRTADNRRWLAAAERLALRGIELFMDGDGSFYLRPDNLADLIVRPKDEHDGATPAPGSIMINNLLKLSRLTEKKLYEMNAQKGLEALAGAMAQYPSRMTSALGALDFYLNDKIEMVLTGHNGKLGEFLKEIYGIYLPHRMIAISPDSAGNLPLFEGRTAPDGKTTVYICRNSVCSLPVTTVEELRRSLEEL